MLRSLVLKHYCHFGNKQAIEEARSRFDAHINNTKLIPSDLKDVIFGACMANGDNTTFDQLIKVWLL